jgi:hypothetical protein
LPNVRVFIAVFPPYSYHFTIRHGLSFLIDGITARSIAKAIDRSAMFEGSTSGAKNPLNSIICRNYVTYWLLGKSFSRQESAFRGGKAVLAAGRPVYWRGACFFVARGRQLSESGLTGRKMVLPATQPPYFRKTAIPTVKRLYRRGCG